MTRLAGASIGLAILLCGAVAASAAVGPSEGRSRLEREIRGAIDEEPWLTESERALIERECGYGRGEWDGRNVSISDGVLTCSNGRRVDSPQVREAMRAAGDRISARVAAIMDRPSIRAAIEAVADEARIEALARLGERWGSRRRDRDRDDDRDDD